MQTHNGRLPAAEPAGTGRHYDVVVAGGGAAGLSGALTLARARRSVLVVDSGAPRNAPAEGVHGYLGLDGTPPERLLATGRAEVARYGGHLVEGAVAAAEPLDGGGFRVTLDDGSTVTAARLLVATGLTDELPGVPGLAERWGREVLHCPYCHGWEVRDRAIAVLATGPAAVHQALLWRQWSEDVTLLAHTWHGPAGEEYERLAARGITVVDGEVTGLEVSGDRLTGVRLAGGREVFCQALVVAPRLTARGLPAGLGLETEEQEVGGRAIGDRVAADATGATAVPGVWVAGNVTDLNGQVVAAAAAGARAAAAINADLIAEETDRAVADRAARRDGVPAAADGTGGVPAGEFWEDFYGARERVWSGRPNAALVRETSGLAPGSALDLGCGEGADSIWLARRGWRVTGVDVSQVALDRAAGHARQAGVADRIDWRRHDLAASFPEGVFDLVSVHFLHAPGSVELPRERILRDAAAAVSPGGVLLIVGHAGLPPWATGHEHDVRLPTAGEVLDSLGLPEREWEPLVSEERPREVTGPDGQPAVLDDSVLKLRRLPG